MKKKTVAIIQARMGSTRFPGKVLHPLGIANRYVDVAPTALWWVCKRVSAAYHVDEVVVATTTHPRDGIIAEYCNAFQLGHVFRGSENDVLGRVYEAATAHEAGVVVDITADCPLVDPSHIDLLFQGMGDGASYMSNIMPRIWPDGLDIQMFTYDTLKHFHLHAEDDVCREHVGWNIAQFLRRMPSRRYTWDYGPPSRYAHPAEWRLTLDTIEDWRLLNLILSTIPGKSKYAEYFGAEEVLEFLLENPQALRINAHIPGKEPRL